MRIVENVTQGSADWLQFRATRFGSSEAAAMLGLSPYSTRSELLRMKHTGLAKEFDEWTQRNLLENGHAIEAATRPIVEGQLGEALYPVTCAEDTGLLVASTDGLTMDEEVAWECKSWNEVLADFVRHGLVPDTHMPQCQHILMVTGAKRLIFTVSDGTEDRTVWCEVRPSKEWFRRLRDGWAQFELDLAAYVLPESAAPAPTGKTPETLPALRIEVTGQVTASNLAEFKQTALATIRSVNRELRTDQDFADAEKAVKWCADVESRLKAAKEHALSQTSTIDALFKALDDIGAEARDVRLDLDKLVTRRKVEVKEHAIDGARRALAEHIASLNAELAPFRLTAYAVDFAGSIKGLKSITSIQDKLDGLLATCKIAAEADARIIRGNAATFKAEAGEYEFLFVDLGQIISKPADDFKALVQGRIAQHKVAEAERERKRVADALAAKRAEEARIAELAAQRERDAAARLAAQVASQQSLLVPAPVLSDKATADANARAWVDSLPLPPAAPERTHSTGAVGTWLGFVLTSGFIEQTLGVPGAQGTGPKSARLWTTTQVRQIRAALVEYLQQLPNPE